MKLEGGPPLDYDHWVERLRDGRSYCCDGLSHLFDFTVNGLGVGEQGDGKRPSVLAVESGKPLEVKVQRRRAAGRQAARRHSREGLGPKAVLARRAGPHRRHATRCRSS